MAGEGQVLGHLEGDNQGRRSPSASTRTALHLNTLTDYSVPGHVRHLLQRHRLTRVLILCTNMMHGLLHIPHQFVSNGLCIILLICDRAARCSR